MGCRWRGRGCTTPCTAATCDWLMMVSTNRFRLVLPLDQWVTEEWTAGCSTRCTAATCDWMMGGVDQWAVAKGRCCGLEDLPLVVCGSDRIDYMVLYNYSIWGYTSPTRDVASAALSQGILG